MSSVVTGTNTFPNSFVIPDVGELSWGPVANSSIKSLANRTVWLKNQVQDIIDNNGLFTEIEIKGQSSESTAGINGGGVLFEYDTSTLTPAIAALFSASQNSWMIDTASLSGDSSLYNQIRIYDTITDTAHFSLRKSGNVVIGSDADEWIDGGSKLQILGDNWSHSVTLSGGVTIDEFSNDITLSDASSASLVTEYAVKGYVDSSIASNSFDASGAEMSIQFNQGDKLNGSSNFLFDISTQTLYLTGDIDLSNYSISEFSNDITLSDASSASLVTEYAVKSYVDNEFTSFAGNITGFAGGSDTQVQFNANGSLSGSSSFTFDNSNDLLTVSRIQLSNTYPVSGISNSTTFTDVVTGGATDVVPTQFAVKTYVDGSFLAANIILSDLQTQVDELSANTSVVDYQSWTATTAITADSTDHYIVTPTTIPGTGSNDVYLPDISTVPDGKEYKIMNRSGTFVDIFPFGSDTINGLNSSVQSPSGSLSTIISLTTDWAFIQG